MCQSGAMNSIEPTPFKSTEERDRERHEKRDAVLRVAVSMFNERGFHATSLDDVGARLKVRKPTIYHYFGNKELILLECLKRGLDQLTAAANVAAEEPGDGMHRLRAFLKRYGEINMSDFGKSVVLTGEEVLSPDIAEQIRKMKREVDEAMRKLILAGMDDGSIAPGNVRLIAFTLAGALNSPARWYDPGKSESEQDIAAAIVDILTKGLEPRR